MKTFVLDTNVLLHDPESITKFPRHQIVIPVTVLEELDKLKRSPNELGRNARAVFRFLDSLQTLGTGNLHTGVRLPNNSLIRIKMEAHHEYPQLSPAINDNKIILAAYELHEKGERVVFVSKDFAARIKAEAIGLMAQDYENLKFAYEAIYKGIRKINVPKHDIDLFYKDSSLTPPESDFSPNEYCILTSPENTSAVAKYNSKSNKIEPLLQTRPLWGIKPRNVEQKIAMDILLRDDIKLVTMMGPAGTGKTLIALAVALHKVFDEGIYTRILVSRPIMPLGRDIGYLPGTKEEKLTPWMQPIYDNLEFLCDSTSQEPSETLRWVTSSEKIEMEAVTYIRGRSLPKMYIIVDEAQNLTPHEVKTIISRAGEGTKVILTGDATQIDNPYLDKDSNGLTYTIGKFKDHALFGHIFLEKTERSELAALAAAVM
ncbi:MAG: PhoH family protein [Parachlamydiales bacterium]|jgi:PhoH-like ATPase